MTIAIDWQLDGDVLGHRHRPLDSERHGLGADAVAGGAAGGWAVVMSEETQDMSERKQSFTSRLRIVR